MTTISSKIIADSMSTAGARLTTFQLTYPWWIHAELMTHRVFSRNASSNRAIPVERVLARVESDPAMPLHWGLNQPGMQAWQQVTNLGELKAIRALWKQHLRKSVDVARELHKLFGLAKQVVNRLTATHQHIDVIVSSTDFNNFFALRCHPDAEPHIRLLAWKMADLYYSSVPVSRAAGDWHLPYVSDDERQTTAIDTLKMCSAARCARVSYLTHDGDTPTVEKDVALYTRLLSGLDPEKGEPGHLSPLEHQAMALADASVSSGNFKGWEQFRKTIHGEVMPFDYEAAKSRGWHETAYAIEKIVE